jgi:hypothetical protein
VAGAVSVIDVLVSGSGVGGPGRKACPSSDQPSPGRRNGSRSGTALVLSGPTRTGGTTTRVSPRRLHRVTRRVNIVAPRSHTITMGLTIESSEPAAGGTYRRGERGTEMTKAFWARAFTTVGSVVALAAVAGAGTKWW